MTGKPAVVTSWKDTPTSVRVHVPKYGMSDMTGLVIVSGRMRVSVWLKTKELHEMGAQVLAAIEHHKLRVDYAMQQQKETMLARRARVRSAKRVAKKR